MHDAAVGILPLHCNCCRLIMLQIQQPPAHMLQIRRVAIAFDCLHEQYQMDTTSHAFRIRYAHGASSVSARSAATFALKSQTYVIT
jgi:hypothetical protein